MPLIDLLGRLHTIATEAGAAGFGVCAADPFDGVRADIEERRDARLHGKLKFTFANPELATDVRQSFPWAERLVVTAWSYLPPAGSPGEPVPGSARIARFATDDHYVPLRDLLHRLAGALVNEGYRAAVLSDDNRLVDRAAAVRAGVGWWGKNTMVLAPGVGPWTLLGSVVTDAPLDASAPMVRDCGTCAACLPACPTGALISPGVLDARRCIAHWAQAPGVIPEEMRVPMGDRLYGCDDCLDACPPGKRLAEASTERVGRVDLAEVLAMDDDSLVERFAHFYIPRRQAKYLRRNALVALGNSGGPDALSIAADYLGHEDWLLRAHAAWALGRLGGEPSRDALEVAHGEEPRAEVRLEIENALATLG